MLSLHENQNISMFNVWIRLWNLTYVMLSVCVKLSKQTTVQATGVASSLVETIQGAGFKLQTLNLSFEDEDEVLV